MSAKDILKSALMEYNGALIIVSHDRDFLDGLIHNIFHFSHKQVKHYPLQIHEFLSKYSVESIDAIVQQRSISKDNGTDPLRKSREVKKQNDREEKKKAKQIEHLEYCIINIEEKISVIDTEMSSEGFYTKHDRVEILSKKRSSLQMELDSLMNEWEQIQSS
jgi:ATP-binding cassette subfamily F protein 3